MASTGNLGLELVGEDDYLWKAVSVVPNGNARVVDGVLGYLMGGAPSPKVFSMPIDAREDTTWGPRIAPAQDGALLVGFDKDGMYTLGRSHYYVIFAEEVTLLVCALVDVTEPSEPFQLTLELYDTESNEVSTVDEVEVTRAGRYVLSAVVSVGDTVGLAVYGDVPAGCAAGGGGSRIVGVALPTRGTATVEYKGARGVTGVPAAQSGEAGRLLRLSDEKPTRNGYYFMGWNEKGINISGEYDYAPGQAIVLPEGGLVLYPTFSEPYPRGTYFTVTYLQYGHGITGIPDAQQVIAGQPFEVTGEVPLRGGYFRFVGWAEDYADPDVIYRPGDVIPSIEGDITLYTIWESTNET